MHYALKKICIMHYELCIKIVNLRKILKIIIKKYILWEEHLNTAKRLR